jgi:hypothetical protein
MWLYLVYPIRLRAGKSINTHINRKPASRLHRVGRKIQSGRPGRILVAVRSLATSDIIELQLSLFRHLLRETLADCRRHATMRRQSISSSDHIQI